MKHEKGWAWPDADQFMLDQMAPGGSYQREHLDEALRYVTDFSVAIDGGAHVGSWSRVLSARFDSVLAFEPAPDTFEALSENVRGFGNVVTYQAALGAGTGSVSLALDAKNEARANTGARYVQPGGAIPMVTIDSLNLKTLGFLKLDVEGSELPALMGARATLLHCQPIVLFEEKGFGLRYGVSRGQIGTFLTDLGYRQLAVISADQIWGPA